MAGSDVRGLGALAAVLGVITGLVALWWWAIAGMSQPVGTAAGLTAGAAIIVGLAVAANYQSAAERQEYGNSVDELRRRMSALEGDLRGFKCDVWSTMASKDGAA